jgi:hypothetical protein
MLLGERCLKMEKGMISVKKEEERGEIKANMESKNVICFWEKGEYFRNSPRKGNIIFSPQYLHPAPLQGTRPIG